MFIKYLSITFHFIESSLSCILFFVTIDLHSMHMQTIWILIKRNAEWKPLQFLAFIFFYRIFEKLKAFEPVTTPVLDVSYTNFLAQLIFLKPYASWFFSYVQPYTALLQSSSSFLCFIEIKSHIILSCRSMVRMKTGDYGWESGCSVHFHQFLAVQLFHLWYKLFKHSFQIHCPIDAELQKGSSEPSYFLYIFINALCPFVLILSNHNVVGIHWNSQPH